MISSLIEIAHIAIRIFFQGLIILVFIRVLMSWAPRTFASSIGQMILRTTEPLFMLVRGLNLRIGPVDLSAIVLLIGLHLVESLLVSVLMYASTSL